MITLDIGQIVPEDILLGLKQSQLDEVLLDIAEGARAKWIDIAMKELFTSRRDYINGIQEVRFRPGIAVITLVGVLPNLIEKGMSETHLHDTLLGENVPTVPKGSRGKHARVEGGYYRAIPFRQATPGTTGAVGQPMGRPYGGHPMVENAEKLGKAIHEAAKKLLRHSPGVMGKAKGGGRLPPGMAPKLRKYHATDIYAGMIREEKHYVKATQNQFTTFRTISKDAEGNKIGTSPWVRPKTPGRQYAKQVNAYVQKNAPIAFEKYVKGLVG